MRREILRLAIPALAALVAEPLLLLGDAAIVGHLGTRELAALGLAGAVMQTVVGLCVFLAYATTAQVARDIGAGLTARALRAGVDGVWLGGLLGLVLTAALVGTAPMLVDLFGARPATEAAATTYLRIAALGTAPLLVMLASTGILRGLRDTRTPMWVALGATVLNLGVTAVLVYPLGWGLPGAAVATVAVQFLAAAVLALVVARGCRRHGVGLRPRRAGVRTAAREGVPLIVRTLALRAALLATTAAVVAAGTDAGADTRLAAHQIAMTVWTFAAYVLDSLAIAAQALIGGALGAGDRGGMRELTRTLTRWGVGAGAVTGVVLIALSPFAGAAFTPDPLVRQALVPVLVIAALSQPLAGLVFLLDGVLIGAGEGRYLAMSSVVVLAVYLPILTVGAHGGGLVGVWLALGAGFMGARAVVLLLRVYPIGPRLTSCRSRSSRSPSA